MIHPVSVPKIQNISKRPNLEEGNKKKIFWSVKGREKMMLGK